MRGIQNARYPRANENENKFGSRAAPAYILQLSCENVCSVSAKPTAWFPAS